MLCIYLSMDPLMDHLVKKPRPYDKPGRMTNRILLKKMTWSNDITITCKWQSTGFMGEFPCLTKPHQHKLSKLLFLLFLETVYNTRKKHRNLSCKRCHKSRGISNFKFSLKLTVYSNQKIAGNESGDLQGVRAVLRQLSWQWARQNGVWENAVLHSLRWHLISQT